MTSLLSWIVYIEGQNAILKSQLSIPLHLSGNADSAMHFGSELFERPLRMSIYHPFYHRFYLVNKSCDLSSPILLR